MYKVKAHWFALSVLLVAIVVLGAGCPVTGGLQVVFFSDPVLEEAVRDTIGKPFGLLTQTDLLSLQRLDGRALGIDDLTGIEYATNLTWLNLNDNDITDLTPLTSLDNLEFLYLNNNDITNITPLAGLHYLNEVTLSGNEVWDLSPLVENALHSPGFGDGEGDFATVDAEDFVDSEGDPLDDAIAEDIATLEAENVEIIFTVPTS